MNLGNVGAILIGVWVFILSAEQLAWFSVSNQMVGFIGVLGAILFIIGNLGIVNYTVPVWHRRAE